MEKSIVKNYMKDIYRVNKVIDEKPIPDTNFKARMFEGKDSEGNNSYGIELIFKEKFVSSFALFSETDYNLKHLKDMFDSVKDLDSIYRFIVVFGQT
jgi:hypothetical protein